MSQKIRFVLTILIVLAALTGNGQSANNLSKIEAELLVSANFSQLDGDRLSGFDKIGLRSGFAIYWRDHPKRSYSISLLYDQRGSSTEIFGGSGFSQHISLNYFALPVKIHFLSWWQESLNRHKLEVTGGIMASRLVNVSSSHSDFDNSADRFNDWDVSLSLGVSYATGKRGSVQLSIERGLTKLYNDPITNLKALQSYWISIGFGYIISQKL